MSRLSFFPSASGSPGCRCWLGSASSNVLQPVFTGGPASSSRGHHQFRPGQARGNYSLPAAVVPSLAHLTPSAADIPKEEKFERVRSRGA